MEGRYQNGKWYPAMIATLDTDGTYTLLWDDGDTKDRVKGPEEVRHPLGTSEDDQSVTDAGDMGGLDASETTEWGGVWKVGDVIGVACDLDRGVMLVSVNGDFSPPNGVAFGKGVKPGLVAGDRLFPIIFGRSVKVVYSFGGGAARPLRFVPEGYAPVQTETAAAFRLDSFTPPAPRSAEERAKAEAEAAASSAALIAAEAAEAAARRKQAAALLVSEVPDAVVDLREEFNAMFERQKALPAETFNDETQYKALIVEAIDAKVWPFHRFT